MQKIIETWEKETLNLLLGIQLPHAYCRIVLLHIHVNSACGDLKDTRFVKDIFPINSI